MAVNYMYPGHLEVFKDFVNIFAKDWNVRFEENRDGNHTLVFEIVDSPFMGYIAMEKDRAQVGIRVDWPMPEVGLDPIKFGDDTETNAISKKLYEHLGDKWHMDEEHIYRDFGKLDANREDWYKAGQHLITYITKMEHKLHP